ncbi:methionyl-tRNA formyltransferase [Pseudonocardia endophytica]|uniref:Methionyl-tRNA formyltransferase n=1 Tax=Pseudonocardia endophytica TaxID=401976 RepID=A0A4R1HV73_PSEEN|nr:methionyl-tRNA formyltransferase [Pseudonocardia endophytica]TCK24580.1 methionyl-tRNA formyltransferase [Pseudonocardia endophytica]
MRIVFVGFATWGHRALSALARSGHEVVLAVTQPPIDDPYYAYLNEDVGALAGDLGVPTMHAHRLNGEAADAVVAADADLMVVANWPSRIEKPVFGAPRLGTLNVHDSLLPRYAGFGAPNWALINDESEVGVTAHMMDDGFDTGDIVARRVLPVSDEDTALTLVERSLDVVAPLLDESLDALLRGRPTVPQDPAEATYFHRRRHEDNRIDWTRPARAIRNLVRAQCDPFPNAHSTVGDTPIAFLDVSVTGRRFGGTAGRVVRDGDDVVVVAGPEARTGREHGVRVNRIRTADGTVVDTPADVLRPGSRLGSA